MSTVERRSLSLFYSLVETDGCLVTGISNSSNVYIFNLNNVFPGHVSLISYQFS